MAAFDAPVSEALSLVLQILLYAGASVFAGTAIFEALIARRIVPSLRPVMMAAGALALTSVTLLAPVSALVILALEPPALLTPARWAPVVLRPTLASALLVWVGVAGALLTAPPGRPSRRGTVLFACPVAIVPVLTGHSATLDPGALKVMDAAHLLGASVWAGGLVGLLLVLVPRVDSSDAAPGDPVEAAVIVGRFSQWAGASVLVIATSGLALAIASLDAVASLWTTDYGRVLSLKLGLVAVVVGLAALNRFRVVPAIRRHATASSAWRALRRVTAAEGVLLGAVLVVTGVLANTHGGHVGH